ncbi:MAG: CopG family transcriptional regulator [Acidimicrobiia bacterium]
MRTTVDLDPDVLAAVEVLQQDRHLGRSEAVNALIRAGVVATRSQPKEFVQRTAALGLRVDVSNVADALEALEGVERR